MEKDRGEHRSLILRILSSKTFLFIFLIITIYALLNVYHNISQRIKVQQEIKNLQLEVENFQKDNDKLGSLIKYFQSEEYVESSSREKLSYKKPGETVIVFNHEQNSQINTDQLENGKKQTNIILWWNYFFNNNNEK